MSTHINWKRMRPRSSALDGSERSISESMAARCPTRCLTTSARRGAGDDPVHLVYSSWPADAFALKPNREVGVRPPNRWMADHQSTYKKMADRRDADASKYPTRDGRPLARPRQFRGPPRLLQPMRDPCRLSHKVSQALLCRGPPEHPRPNPTGAPLDMPQTCNSCALDST